MVSTEQLVKKTRKDKACFPGYCNAGLSVPYDDFQDGGNGESQTTSRAPLNDEVNSSETLVGTRLLQGVKHIRRWFLCKTPSLSSRTAVFSLLMSR